MENYKEILKPTLVNLEKLSEGDVVTLFLGQSVDGLRLIDSEAIVSQPIVEEDTIVDYVIIVQDATGRKGEEQGSTRRLISEFEGFIIK